MQKGLKIFSAVIFVLILIVAVLFYANPESESMVNIVIYFAYILTAIAILCTLILPLPLLFQYPKKLKKVGLSLLLVVVVFGIGYILSSGDPINLNIENQPSEQTLKLTDTGLIVTYILVAVSIITIVGGSVKSILDKKQ
jgi:Ca2+/Na+ antiporter